MASHRLRERQTLHLRPNLRRCLQIRLLQVRNPTTEKDKLSAALSLVGYTQTECHSDLSTQLAANFIPSIHTALIAFKGTQADDINDLATDAHFTQTRWSAGGQVHLGFEHAQPYNRVPN